MTDSGHLARCISHGGQRGTAQMGRVFQDELVTINYSYFLEPTMLELLKSLVFAVVMVPVVMAVILGLIYGLGEVFNLFSGAGHKDSRPQNH